MYLTRKHYNAIGRAIRTATDDRERTGGALAYLITKEIARTLSQNPRFQADKFFQAAGYADVPEGVTFVRPTQKVKA